jgi:hypothetical protein
MLLGGSKIKRLKTSLTPKKNTCSSKEREEEDQGGQTDKQRRKHFLHSKTIKT